MTNKVTTYHDQKTRGLILMVRSSDKKIFALYRLIGGKPVQITIGHFPDMSIGLVREKATAFNTQIAEGQHPQKTSSNPITFATLFHQYMAQHAKLYKKTKTWRADLSMFERHLSKWSNLALSDIQPEMIRILHMNIGEKHVDAANKLLGLIRGVFNKAIAWGYYHQTNPTQHIQKFKSVARE